MNFPSCLMLPSAGMGVKIQTLPCQEGRRRKAGEKHAGYLTGWLWQPGEADAQAHVAEDGQAGHGLGQGRAVGHLEEPQGWLNLWASGGTEFCLEDNTSELGRQTLMSHLPIGASAQGRGAPCPDMPTDLTFY